jgi:hypothetical protein
MSMALDELATEIAVWRSSKERYEHMPRPLIERARRLAAEIPEQEICRRLSVRRSKLFPKARAIQPEREFVELPSVQIPAATEPVRVEIRERDFTVAVTLPGQVDLAELFSALRGSLR